MIEEVVLESEVEKRFAPSSLAPTRVQPQVDPELEADLARIPDKMAFKIGEVAEMIGVKPYVLRYWETEFQVLRPKKSKHNQRMYERRDVENLFLIKKLLYRDRFSIEGARAAMKNLKKDTVRVKQISTIAEHIDQARDLVMDLVDEIGHLKQLLK